MKIIEFRAWDGLKMLHNVGVHPFIMAFHGADDDSYDENSEGAYTLSQKFESYKIMQFTNILDKNKEKIFEDDIVEWEGEKQGIKFSHTCRVLYDDKEFFGYVLKSYAKDELGNIPIGAYGANPKELKVIGNVYQNLNLNFSNN